MVAPAMFLVQCAKSGAKDYWSVRPYLRKETQNYVPKFIAVNYIMNYASEHNIYPTTYKFTMAETDTVSINQSMTFEVLSKTLRVDIDIIKELNPFIKETSYLSAKIAQQVSAYLIKQ